MLFMAEQYIVPILINSLESLDQMHFGRLLERILKLSVRDFIFICILLLFSFLLMCVTFSYPLDTEHVYLVAHVLQLLPSLSQFTCRSLAVRGPRILQGLVEQYHPKVHPLFPLHQLSRSHFVMYVKIQVSTGAHGICQFIIGCWGTCIILCEGRVAHKCNAASSSSSSLGWAMRCWSACPAIPTSLGCWSPSYCRLVSLYISFPLFLYLSLSLSFSLAF